MVGIEVIRRWRNRYRVPPYAGYIFQLEAGTKTGALGTLRSLAAALKIDLDDLEPWVESAKDD